MNKLIAKIFSIAFQPLLCPTIGLILYVIYGQLMEIVPMSYKLLLLAITFCFTALIPSLIIFILLKMGAVSDINLYKREERIIPMILTCISFVVGAFIIKQFNAPPIISIFISAASISIAVIGFISLRWKISAHLTGIGGLTSAILITSLYSQLNGASLLAVAFVISGIVGSSRIKLKAHTPAQVYAGFAVGFLSVLVLFTLNN